MNLLFKVDLSQTYLYVAIGSERLKTNPLMTYTKGAIVSFSKLTTMEARRGELMGR